MRKAIIYFFTAICLLSCKSSDRVPKNIIKPEKMKSILWDVMRAQSLAQETAAKDTTLSVATQTKILSQKVFEIHKTDSVRFAQSYNWYVKHPETLKLIFDSLYAQKQRLRELNLLQKEKQAGHPLENKSTNVK
jgi:Leucine-rich repeat (LRR) protein